MYKILKNTIEMDDYSVQKLSNQPPEPFEWNIVEGTELNVNDCIGGKGKIEVKGNTEQKQLSGKNLFDRDNVIEKNGTINDNNIFRGGGGNYCIVIPCKSNTTYTAQKRNDGDTNRFALASCETNPSDTADVTTPLLNNVRNDSAGNLSITTGSTANYIIMQYFRNVESTLTKQQILDSIQIEEGSTATDYEPYCGGQASPNPEYPQEIKVVTGDNVVKHVGKNLLNMQNFSNNGTGRTNYSTVGDAIAVTALSAGTYRYIYNEIRNLEIGKPYTIKIGDYKDTSNNEVSQFGITNSFGNYYVYVQNLKNTQVLTFVPTENKVIFRCGYLQNACELGDTLTLTNIQLEEGSTATSYEPYRGESFNLNLGSIELCKIGDYKDILFKNVSSDENYNSSLIEGAWYKKGVIGKIVLNGTETGWQKSTSFSGAYYRIASAFGTDKKDWYCNYLKIVTAQSSFTVGKGYNNGNLVFWFGDSTQYPNVDSFKSMLSTLYNNNTPVIVYVVLTTSTYTQITDTTLISQLEALRKAKWFKGVNHWFTETEKLEPVLKGTYKQAINE